MYDILTFPSYTLKYVLFTVAGRENRILIINAWN